MGADQRGRCLRCPRGIFDIREPRDALEFLRAYGPWQITKVGDTKALQVEFAGLIQNRKFYEDALLVRKIWGSQIASTDTRSESFSRTSTYGKTFLWRWCFGSLQLFWFAARTFKMQFAPLFFSIGSTDYPGSAALESVAREFTKSNRNMKGNGAATNAGICDG